jgi:alpha-beta hydrolase superfamily lysophospholipase
MLHGLQSHSGWFAQSGAFAASLGVPVYAIDRYGSGLSKAPRGGYRALEDSLEDILIAARYAMDRHGKKSIHILGHCFGALTAAAFVSVHSDIVKSLILPTPALYTRTDVRLVDKAKIFYSMVSGREVRVPVPLTPEMMSDMDEFVDFAGKDPLSLRDAAGKSFLEIKKTRRFVKSHFRDIAAPVFMALAGKDPISRNDKNVSFFDSLNITDKKLKTYKQALHILEFSPERDEFFADLASWLDAHNK